MLDYPEDNTDDEQEELPYDDDLRNIYPHNCDSQNVKDFTSIENTSQSLFPLPSPQISNNSEEQSNCHTQLHQRNNGTEIAMATEKELPAGDFNSSGTNPHFSNSNISDVLLRHFPKEELSSSCQLIDCETIPEISLTESFDETILNKIKISENTRISSPKQKSHLGETHREEKCESIDKSWDLIVGKQSVVDERMNFSCVRKDCKDNPQFVTQKEDTVNEVLKTKEEYQEKKCFLEMSGSSHKFRYGQRQVNYQLPDFSKVAPKVKIPKGNNKCAPVIKRTKSSPNLLGKSAIVKGILEEMNYLDCVAMNKQEVEMKNPEFDQQLELLTKQADAQNCIDHQRFNAKMLPSTNSCSPKLSIKARSGGITSEISTVPPVTVPVKPMLGLSQTSVSELPSRRMVSPLPSAGASAVSPPPLLQKATEGEKFSQMLKEQTEELKTKVETFSKYMAQDVLPLEERHQILKLLKEYLDQLEWNYLDTKEKHCALHLQHYRHLSTGIGEFDPDRRVEGEIFKLGMLLEDIKEKIDKTGSPNYSTFTTSPSLTPCESVCSSYSSGAESAVISSISESPSRTATGVNIFKNETYGENRNHLVEVISQRKNQQPTQSQLGPQKRTVYEQRIVEALEKSTLPTNEQSTHYCYFSSDKEIGGLQSQRQFPTNQNYNRDQENTDGNLSYWEMKSPPPANPCGASNKESTGNLTLLKKQGSLTYPSDHRFLEELENSAKEHNIIIHPRLKIQLSSKQNKQIHSSSSSRYNKTECKQTNTVKADTERFSVFLEGTTVDLDVSGSDTEDTSFGEFKNNSRSELFLEPKTKHHELWKVDERDQNKALSQRDRKTHFHSERKRNNFEKSNECGIACSHKKSLALQRFYFNKQPEEFIYKLSDTQNLHIPKTHYSRMHDTIILSPQYLDSRNVHGRSMSELRNKHIEDTESKILNSTLDHVIQTANNLKRTTEHMVHVISEDLARAKTQTSPNITANQYYI